MGKVSQLKKTSGLNVFLPFVSFRLASDQWVVGRRVEERQVYFVVALKNSQLPEVMELVNKVIASEFRNISLLEK